MSITFYPFSVLNDTFSWTVDKTACLRNIRPGHEGRQRFNTTLLETCGAVVNYGGCWTAGLVVMVMGVVMVW